MAWTSIFLVDIQLPSRFSFSVAVIYRRTTQGTATQVQARYYRIYSSLKLKVPAEFVHYNSKNKKDTGPYSYSYFYSSKKYLSYDVSNFHSSGRNRHVMNDEDETRPTSRHRIRQRMSKREFLARLNHISPRCCWRATWISHTRDDALF
jgi:hypothetical protein